MKLPKSWNQLRVEQFNELWLLDEESFGSLFLYNLEVLAIVTDTDADEIDISTEELTQYITELRFLRKEPHTNFKRELLNLKYKTCEQLTLGEFIDLEYYFGIDYVKNLTTIASVFYKRYKLDDFDNVIYEPYSYNPSGRAELFDEVMVTDIYGIISEYLKFRTDFMKAYENLFQPEIEETDEEEMDVEDKKAEEEEERVNKWAWERMLYELAGGDLTKIETITDLPLVMVFNFMSMKTELKLD